MFLLCLSPHEELPISDSHGESFLALIGPFRAVSIVGNDVTEIVFVNFVMYYSDLVGCKVLYIIQCYNYCTAMQYAKIPEKDIVSITVYVTLGYGLKCP